MHPPVIIVMLFPLIARLWVRPTVSSKNKIYPPLLFNSTTRTIMYVTSQEEGEMKHLGASYVKSHLLCYCPLSHT